MGAYEERTAGSVLGRDLAAFRLFRKPVRAANFETDEIVDEREKGGRRGSEKAGFKVRRPPS